MLLERFRLTDRVAVITGAGRGIGAATARALAEAGADVVLTARTKEQLEQVAGEVEALGRRAAVVAADLSDLENLPKLVDVATDTFGRLDVVVNNVGGWMPRPFLDTSERSLEEAFRFNVTTAFALSRAAVPKMLEGDGGSIVNISSVMGHVAGRGYAAYATAKGALTHLTRQMAHDLAPRIRVNAIACGSIATSALEVVLDNEDLRREMVDKTPLRRLGDPEDIALGVLYLASPAGGFVTGRTLGIDGGIDAPNLDMRLPDL